MPLGCVSFSLLIGPERKYSTPIHHTTEHIPEKKFKSEALLSTLTSDASKENTPGKGTVGPHSLKDVCLLTAVCVVCRLSHQQYALICQQCLQRELLSASGLLQPECFTCWAWGRSWGHNHGCCSGGPGHGAGQNPQPAALLLSEPLLL